MKDTSEVIEEISLYSPPEAKESYVKQKTRAKFQQLIKSSSQLSSQQSTESTEQVEETPLLVKSKTQSLTENSDNADGSTNMGFTHEDDQTSLAAQNFHDKDIEISSIDEVYPGQETTSNDKSYNSYFVKPVPRERQSKSQKKDDTFSGELQFPPPKPAARTRPSSTIQSTQPIRLTESEQSVLLVSSNAQTSLGRDTLQKGDNSDSQNAQFASDSNYRTKALGERMKNVEGSGTHFQKSSAVQVQGNSPHRTKVKTKENNQKGTASTEKRHKQKTVAESSSCTVLDNKLSAGGAASSNDDSLEADKVLGVFIHHCDRLRTELMVSHPLVRVHIIDAHKGTYVKKSNMERAVTSFYETQRKDVDAIMPIMTQPSQYIEKKLPYPSWEELLVFNENFSYFIQEGMNAILFFEVLDFFKALSGGKKYRRLHNQSGWQKIAWAFLKLVGSNNVINTGKKLRLQLYKVPSIKKSLKSTTVEVFDWWNQKRKAPLQSSLYVSVEPIALVEVEPAMRSMLPMQAEKGRTTLDELTKTLDNGTAAVSPKSSSSCEPSSSDTSLGYQWTKLPEQPCEIPNVQMNSLSTSNSPCFSLRFSHNGRALAAGCGAKEQHCLIVYEIPSGNVLYQQIVHTGIIYDLEWFVDDKWLLTASADCTVRLWNVGSWNCIAVLPHPSFVYCAKFQLPFFSAIATGSYDHVVRFWEVTSDSSVHLLREVEGHHSHINTICWDHSGTMLLTADNIGEIKMWNTQHYGKMPNRDIAQNWGLEKECSPQELKGVPVNSMSLVNNEKMLLLFCRDSMVRLFDFTKNKIVQRYSGSVNCQNLLHGSLSPCGNLVFLGGEDGRIHVWDFHSGTTIAVYLNLPFTEPVLCVDYHPHDHIIAMCSLEASMPILVYKYDETAPLIQEALPVRQETDHRTKVKTSGSSSNFYDMYSMSETSLEREVSSGLDNKYPFPKPKSSLERHYKPSTSEVLPQPKSPISKGYHLGPEVKIVSSLHEEKSSASWGSTLDSASAEYIALYDYKPQRGDEIALRKGDKVSVVKFDTDNWWIGFVENGKQGYFPSNIVAPNDGNKEVYGVDDDVYEDTPQALTAVITTSGKFEIISGPEESDELIHLSPRKKRLAKKKQGILDDQLPSVQSSKRCRRRSLLKSLQEPR